MPKPLYLDTARLGQMTPRALAAHQDFGRLVAEVPFSLYGERLLLGGFSAWPASYQRRFPGLRTWHGVAALKASLRRLLGAADPLTADHQPPIVLASRTAVLMQTAAKAVFRRCQRVLTTDLSWPAYQAIVEQEAHSAGGSVVRLYARTAILRHGVSTRDLSDMIAAAFSANACDGLFLPAVDHLGIRVPVAEIVDRISRGNELRFVAIDAAQAFCHVPLGDIVPRCDVVVAGCHKWLGAYHPLGVACFGRVETRGELDAMFRQHCNTLPVPDALSHFVTQLEHGNLARYSETVQLFPLFTAAAAIADYGNGGTDLDEVLKRRQANADELIRTAANAGWQPLRPANAMCSGALLLRPLNSDHRRLLPNELRDQLCRAGLLVTTYHGGLIRVSLPTSAVNWDDRWQMSRAMQTALDTGAGKIIYDKNPSARSHGSRMACTMSC